MFLPWNNELKFGGSLIFWESSLNKHSKKSEKQSTQIADYIIFTMKLIFSYSSVIKSISWMKLYF